MSKQKRKSSQQNFLQYFLNEFVLFRHDFSYVTEMSLSETVDRIRNLSYQERAWWGRRRTVAKVTDYQVDEISFEIKSEQPNKSNYYQSAKAEGTIFADDDGMTIVEGSITMGGRKQWLGIIALLSFIIFIYWRINQVGSSTPEEFTFIGLFYVVILLYMWGMMYRDRNYLANIIKNAVVSETSKVGA